MLQSDPQNLIVLQNKVSLWHLRNMLSTYLFLQLLPHELCAFSSKSPCVICWQNDLSTNSPQHLQQISCCMLSFHCAVSDVQGETGWKAHIHSFLSHEPIMKLSGSREHTHTRTWLELYRTWHVCISTQTAAAAGVRWLVVIRQKCMVRASVSRWRPSKPAVDMGKADGDSQSWISRSMRGQIILYVTATVLPYTRWQALTYRWL